MKLIHSLRGGLGIGLLLIAMLSCTSAFAYREYFQLPKSGPQLDNFQGTKYLDLEYPGRSAEFLYKRALEIFRGSSANEERVENCSLEFYGEQQKKSGHKYFYRYSVKFKDGKVRVENPYILMLVTIPGIEGYPDVNQFRFSIEQSRDKDKEKNRDYYNDILKVVDNEISEIVAYFNLITDDLAEFLKPDSLEDPSKWKATDEQVSFMLTPEGLKNNLGLDYFVFELPGKEMKNIQARIGLLLNLLNSTDYAFKQLTNLALPIEVQELFKLTSPWPQYSSPDIYSKIKVGPYQTISIKSKGAIKPPKSEPGTIGYDIDIIYADGKIKIGSPKITYLSQEYTGGYEGIVGYKFINVKSGIFNEKDSSVLYPEHKAAVEEHFTKLIAMIKRYLKSDAFEKVVEW